MKQLNMNDVKIKALKTNSDLHVEKLTNVNASGWEIAMVSDDFFDASRNTLKTINLNNNKLEVFPSIYQCSILTVLKLNHNKITFVPEELASVISLKTIDLSNNKIHTMSEEVYWLPKLESLDLGSNNINEIPPRIWNKTHVFCLNFSKNREIISVPNDILADSKVHKLVLTDTSVDKKELLDLPGMDNFTQRRKDRVDIAIWNDIGVNHDIWGI